MTEGPKHRTSGVGASSPPVADGVEDFEQTRTAVLVVGDQSGSHATLVPRAPYLTAIAGPRAGEIYPIDREETVLGRGREAHVMIDSDGVSRKHARIVRQGEELVLEDLGSRNGTFVQQDGREDVRVRFRRLADGDRIQVGTEVILRFDLLDEREAKLQKQLYESAVRDALTGAYNRQYFQDRFGKELSAALAVAALGGPVTLGLVILDVDHFKKINDTWGHPAGDAVLQALVAAIQRAIRPDVVFARIGGEEFVLLVRNVDRAALLTFAERLRETLEALIIPWKTGAIPITSSVGVAMFDELRPPASAELAADQLMTLADERLYAAKTGGRNRVVGPRG